MAFDLYRSERACGRVRERSEQLLRDLVPDATPLPHVSCRGQAASLGKPALMLLVCPAAAEAQDASSVLAQRLTVRDAASMNIDRVLSKDPWLDGVGTPIPPRCLLVP